MDKREPKIINIADHTGWGDSISFFNWESRQISGNMTPMPEEGDFLIEKMNSEKTALFKITEIKPCLYPQDQFFGTVTDLGYVEDIQKAITEFGIKLQDAFRPMVEAIGNLVDDENFKKFVIEYHKKKTEKEEEGVENG